MNRKKKNLLAVAAVAIATVATLSVALNNSSSLSGVNLANAKALAAAVATTTLTEGAVAKSHTCYDAWLAGTTKRIYDCANCAIVDVAQPLGNSHIEICSN
jgi:hypothetical protein